MEESGYSLASAIQEQGQGHKASSRLHRTPSLHSPILHLPHAPSCFPGTAGARLLLPLRWVPDRLGNASWVLSEPPTGHGAWVDELSRQLELLRDRLAQVGRLRLLAESESAELECWASAFLCAI